MGDQLEDETTRRRRVGLAGHRGEEAVARAGLDDLSPRVRAAALSALARIGRLERAAVGRALGDPEPWVRRRACELGAALPGIDLVPMLSDPDPAVTEAAAWAMGEQGIDHPRAIDGLVAAATGHADPLCREAAVAALGAIGAPRGLPAILAATSDRPAVRRRAVIALAPFSGPEVDAALRRALSDRDWQVRQAAEDLLEGEPGD